MRKKYNKLLLIDIICHGVPSPKIFEEYLNFLENRYKGKIENFNFRNKIFGWKSCIESFKINGKYIIVIFMLIYF